MHVMEVDASLKFTSDVVQLLNLSNDVHNNIQNSCLDGISILTGSSDGTSSNCIHFRKNDNNC